MAVSQSRQPGNQPFRPKKLIIISSCLVEGGIHKERGDEYTPNSAEETYNLIRAQRAIESTDEDVEQLKKELADEAKAKVATATTAKVPVAPVK